MTRASSSPDPNKVQWAANLPCKKGACRASREEKKEFKIKWDPLCLFAPRASKCRTSRNGDDSQPARLRRATFRPGALNDPPPQAAEDSYGLPHKYRPHVTVVRQSHSNQEYLGREQGFERIRLKSALSRDTDFNLTYCI